MASPSSKAAASGAAASDTTQRERPGRGMASDGRRSSQPSTPAPSGANDVAAAAADGAGQADRKRKARQDASALAHDGGLAELLLMMDDFHAIIPDSVTDYYMAKSGVACDDVRLKRLLALAAQKFVADVATDALHYSKLRQQIPIVGPKKSAVPKDKRLVMTMEDLSAALAERGINIKKPDYFT